jgi:hypothetical protein
MSRPTVIRVTNVKEHDFEPVPGLPAPLPEGEAILWQGAPHWRAFSERAMHIRLVGLYFAALIAWGIAGGVADKAGAAVIAVSSLRLAGLGLVAVAVLCGYGWLVARTTLYTVTTKRVVMRIGIALPVTIQVPFALIDGAAVQMSAGGSGDIALTLRAGTRIAYLLLWPHARPWKYTRSEPSLRGIADVAAVAQVLGRALAASAEQAAVAVPVVPAASDRPAHVPAAA